MEARQHLLAQVVFVIQRTLAPAYNAVAVSCDRAGLPRRGRLSRPRRLTTRRATHPSAPAFNATAGSSVYAPLMQRSSLPSISRGLVYINTPGRTCLHVLFIESEQVTAWEARFSSNKLEANYHVLSAAVCTGWLNGQAHKSPPL